MKKIILYLLLLLKIETGFTQDWSYGTDFNMALNAGYDISKFYIVASNINTGYYRPFQMDDTSRIILRVDSIYWGDAIITPFRINAWQSVYSAMPTFSTSSNTQTFTNKSGNISQWTNDAGYVTGLSFSSLSGKPTTLSGYGITDPIVLTTNSYSNPSWLTTLAHSKVTYSGATSEYIRGDGSLASFPEIDAIPVGAVVSGIWSSAPDGYLLLRGGTIGDATSGATVFANELMEDLFICLWEHLADSEAPVSGGRGVSASADWAAHKTITLPDSRQKFILGKATSGTGTTLGGTGGSIDHVHTVDPPNTTSSESANINNVTLLALGSAASPSHTHDVNINQFNSGVNNPPFISLNFAIKY